MINQMGYLEIAKIDKVYVWWLVSYVEILWIQNQSVRKSELEWEHVVP